MGDGWLTDSNVEYLTLAKDMEAIGVKTYYLLIYPRTGHYPARILKQLRRINEAVICNIIASGGIHTLKDIQDLKEMGLYGAICEVYI